MTSVLFASGAHSEALDVGSEANDVIFFISQVPFFGRCGCIHLMRLFVVLLGISVAIHPRADVFNSPCSYPLR
jgi:hypothetical protein